MGTTARGGTPLGARIERSPVYERLRTCRDMAMLGPKTVRLAVTPPINWVPDAIIEANQSMKRTIIPLTISQAIWIIGFGVLNFGEVAYSLGVSDRAPGGVMVGFTREVSTWITMMILAGVAGSALAADIGARKIREELDAMAVLGVDQFRTLIVPRVMAMVYVALVLGLIGLLVPIATYYALVPAFLEFPASVYRESTYLNLQPIDLFSTFFKHALMGFFIGIVACERGLATKGGAEGVGLTVTQTVVISFFGIWAFNSVYNIGFLTLFPDLLVLKG
ncbi:MAG: transporter substrate-binding protein [Solirubrobacterales bacterium]|nr:transporter substrate-binding protein [Solirubrobacterales bacterium]